MSMVMTEFFNRDTANDQRRKLRNSMPKAEVYLWGPLKGRRLLGCKFRRQYSVARVVRDATSWGDVLQGRDPVE